MMDWLLRIWLWLGRWFRRRPVQILLLSLGAVIAAGALGYSLATTNDNKADIDTLKEAFCSPLPYESRMNNIRCQKLLDELLENPTPEQGRRLREIVEEGS